MNKFNTALVVGIIGEYKFRLHEALHLSTEKMDIIVYGGFEFDGASIPRSLWTTIGCPIGGKYSSASCIHDALYATHLLSRSHADRIFYKAMLASGVERRVAIQMYLAVRAFGQSAYDEKSELQTNREFVEIILKD